MMRTLFVLALAALWTGCGRTVLSPTAPSATPSEPGAGSVPDLSGNWFGSGTVVFVDLGNGTRLEYGCDHSWSVTSQSGGSISGTSMITGRGATSDPYCTHSGTFTGTISSAGALTSLRLQPPLDARACTQVSGDGTFTGTASTTSFTARMSDQWTCTDPAGRPFNAERTVTLSLQKRAT